MTEVIRVLREEHANMTKLLNVLERQIEIYGGGGIPDDAIVRDILDYCLGY
jgi:hemerythrin-like domain-containing protein